MDNFRTQTAHLNDDGGLVIVTKQDVTDIVERNKIKQEEDKLRTKGIDDTMHLIASVPFTVIDELNKMKIMKGFVVTDQKAFTNWLNKDENNVWKLYRGKL